MANFFKNSFFFILGFILLNIIFYFVITKPAIYEKYIFNENSIDDYNMFLISDSHGAFLRGIPDLYDIYNFSYSSDNYLDMFLKITYLSTKLTKNDTIFLTIDYHNLSSYKDETSNIKMNIVYSNYNLSIIDKEDLQNYKLWYKKYLKYLPLLDVDFSRFHLQYYIPQKMPSLGYSFADYTESQQNNICSRRYNGQFLDRVKSKRQLKYLNKILALSKEHDFILIGIEFPITKKYWQMIKDKDFGRVDLCGAPEQLNKSVAKSLCEQIKLHNTSQ
ncbi:MAG: hypothetical protein P8Y99_03385 [Calditrichaceae bacterium]